MAEPDRSRALSRATMSSTHNLNEAATARTAAERVGIAGIAATIEAKYWDPIRTGALVENFIFDPALAAAPGTHPGLFSDHGATHVRDIAELVLELAERNDARLIPERPSERAAFITQIAVLLTYLHDVGMVAPTRAARRVHPQFAAQLALGTEFAEIVERTWQSLTGVRHALERVHVEIGGQHHPSVLLREVWAMSLAHSKSAVPVAFLDDRPSLRALMQRAVFIPLETQATVPPQELLTSWPTGELAGTVEHYGDFGKDSFAWLVDPSPSAVNLADDVIDAVRLLRAADALRQRGVSLRTSGGYEICVNPRTGEAVYGLRSTDGKHAALLAVDNPISAAESNIAFAELGSRGQLRIGFNRAFSDATVGEQILRSTADLIADIEADAIASFTWPSVVPNIELVTRTEDESFADAVAALVQSRHPHLGGRIATVVRVPTGETDAELSWLRDAERLQAGDPRLTDLLAEMSRHGLHVAAVDAPAALRDVRFVSVEPNTIVMRAGTTSPVVLVPMGEGLHVRPTSGHESQSLRSWLPVGATGVVRGGQRNADVYARRRVDVLVISAESYLAHWFRPYSIEEIAGVVSEWRIPRR